MLIKKRFSWEWNTSSGKRPILQSKVIISDWRGYYLVWSDYLVLTKFLKIIAPNALALTQILCLCGCLLKFWTESRFCLKSLSILQKNPSHTIKSLFDLNPEKKLSTSFVFTLAFFYLWAFTETRKIVPLRYWSSQKMKLRFITT